VPSKAELPQEPGQGYDIHKEWSSQPRWPRSFSLRLPEKSWFMALRIYGPLQPWIDPTWRSGEIELVE